MIGQEREAGRHPQKNKRDKDSQSRSEMLKGVLNGGREEHLKKRDGLGGQGDQGLVRKEKDEVQPLGTGQSGLGTEWEG